MAPNVQMAFCCIHRFVLCSAIITEASSCADGNKHRDHSQTLWRKWETWKHSVLNGIFLSLPSGIKGPTEEEAESLRASAGRGNQEKKAQACTRVSVYILWLLIQCFYEILLLWGSVLWMCKQVVSHSCPLGPFPFCLSCLTPTCWVFVFILLLLSLRKLWFPNERQKGRGSGWEGKWAGTGRIRGRGNSNQDVLCEGKHLFSLKKN